MEMQERFEKAGFTLKWEYGINWYYAFCDNKRYLRDALKTVLGWDDYDCDTHIFEYSGATWAVGFHI